MWTSLRNLTTALVMMGSLCMVLVEPCAWAAWEASERRGQIISTNFGRRQITVRFPSDTRRDAHRQVIYQVGERTRILRNGEDIEFRTLRMRDIVIVTPFEERIPQVIEVVSSWH